MLERRGRVAAVIVVVAAAAAIAVVITLKTGSNGEEGLAPPRSDTMPEIRTVCDSADTDRPCRFDPARATVRVGQTVRWINAGDVFHTVTSTRSLDRREPSGLFDRSLAGRSESFEFRFEAPGTYAFYCRPHSEFMFGVVEVAG